MCQSTTRLQEWNDNMIVCSICMIVFKSPYMLACKNAKVSGYAFMGVCKNSYVLVCK